MAAASETDVFCHDFAVLCKKSKRESLEEVRWKKY